MTRIAGTPSWTSVFGAQLRATLGLRRRAGWLLLGAIVVQLVLLASQGLVFGLRIQSAEPASAGQRPSTQVEMSRLEHFDLGAPVDEGLAAVWAAGVAGLLIAALWPIRVWGGEPPAQRDYHWAMPVDRAQHDLLRTAAGAVGLAGITAGLVLVAAGTAWIFDHAGLFSRLTPWFWLNLLVAPLLVYLAASMVYVRAPSRPTVWLWGGAAALSTVASLAAEWAPESFGALVRPIFGGSVGLLRVLFGPLFREISGTATTSGGAQLLGWLLWASVFAAGLWVATHTRPKRL